MCGPVVDVCLVDKETDQVGVEKKNVLFAVKPLKAKLASFEDSEVKVRDWCGISVPADCYIL